MKLFKIFLLTVLASSFLFFNLTPVSAVGSLQDYPVYIVQPGDTINIISIKFNVSADDIIAANNISDPNVLNVNSRLVIPGITGVSGVLDYSPVSIGETPDVIARVNQISKDTIFKLNRITSPSEFYIGSNVILVQSPEHKLSVTTISGGSNLFEKSIQENDNLWKLVLLNQADQPWFILPSESIVVPDLLKEQPLNDVFFTGLPMTQGLTALVHVRSENDEVSGYIGNIGLNFFPDNEYYSAFIGIHALMPAGLYPIHLEFTNHEREKTTIDQSIMIQQGFYPKDPPLFVDPSTLDESLMAPEEEIFNKIVAPFTPEKYWQGIFIYPVDEPICIKSWFGNRRSYNDQPYNRYHTGVDFGVCANLNIYAPADGKVVLVDSFLTRGTATIIDHGLGVYSGYWHQSSTAVKVGDFVKAGDLIGEIGSTGRSTGPHLHWELIVNGVPVNPLPWLEQQYP